MSAAEKGAVVAMVAKDAPLVSAGRAKVRIGKCLVHVRYCSPNAKALKRYKFNINPNTLSADYELWICGSAAIYYLLMFACKSDIC